MLNILSRIVIILGGLYLTYLAENIGRTEVLGLRCHWSGSYGVAVF